MSDLSKCAFIADEDGAAMVEYSILVGLVSALLVALVSAISVNIADRWALLSSVLPGG